MLIENIIRGNNIVTYHRNYCLECDWRASNKNHSRDELARLAIEHFQETQHTIESETSEESAETPKKSAQPTDSYVVSDTGTADSAVDD